jgi:hypothetical protein
MHKPDQTAHDSLLAPRIARRRRASTRGGAIPATRNTRTAISRKALTARATVTARHKAAAPACLARRPIQQPMPPTHAKLTIELRYAATVASAHRPVSAECARGERRRANAHVHHAALQTSDAIIKNPAIAYASRSECQHPEGLMYCIPEAT